MILRRVIAHFRKQAPADDPAAAKLECL